MSDSSGIMGDANMNQAGHGNRGPQFVRNYQQELNTTRSDLRGSYVLTTGGNPTNAYNKDNWHKENCDISGIIRIPFPTDGCYFDVYVDGKEIKETVIDVEQSFYDNELGVAAFDMSKTYCTYNNDASANSLLFTDEIKATRKTVLKDELTKLDIVDAGIYSFYRLGNCVKFMANLEDLDSEIAPAMKFPTIKIIERGDVNGKCAIEYTDMYIPLQDVESTLEPEVNLLRTKIRSGIDMTGNNAILKDNSGIIVSRWSPIYIPIDVSGELERGEEFEMRLKDDKWFSCH